MNLEWRTKVFERDNYTCQICGVKNCFLTAHHIKSRAKFPKLRYNVSNGITLCELCHAKSDWHYAKFRIDLIYQGGITF